MINRTAILTFIYLGVFSWQSVLADTVNYLDGSSGHDSNTGTSQHNPWRSLAKVQGIEFKPGDKILLNAGCQFTGRLHPKGSGLNGSPIVIDRYDEGANPIVAGEGKVENTIRLHNQHHWEIRNLTVSNREGGGWNDEGRGKHNNGVPLFISHLMLDLPIMRGSAVHNWRQNPIIIRGKDGAIKRNKVTYTTPGFLFYD